VKTTVLASLTYVSVVVDHAHAAHPIAKIGKVKDLAFIIFISFNLPNLHILSNKHLKQSFSTFFAHNRLMQCSSSVANAVAEAALLLTSFLHRC